MGGGSFRAVTLSENGGNAFIFYGLDEVILLALAVSRLLGRVSCCENTDCWDESTYAFYIKVRAVSDSDSLTDAQLELHIATEASKRSGKFLKDSLAPLRVIRS